MSSALSRFARTAFAPPKYLASPTLGIDLSTSGVKGVALTLGTHGIELVKSEDIRFPLTALVEGEVTDRTVVVNALRELSLKLGSNVANIALPESKSYLFETHTAGETKEEWKVGVEQHIDEHVPLPPPEVMFDILPIGHDIEGTKVIGVGYAKRIVEEIITVAEEAGLIVRALESETFAAVRSLVPFGDPSTVCVIDIGKTSTKFVIAEEGVPRFATTIGIGGHSFTLSVQKHFGVTETEARLLKLSRGIVPGEGNEDYFSAMLSTASAIRDELTRRLDYWQSHATSGSGHSPVTRAVLVGGNASVRGLAEYFEATFRIPVSTGNVFANFAPPEEWLPHIDYTQSLVFSTAIGLALREYAP